jgi:cellulose synthase/poly-beta-1,6-N-acetylglucosamine synthase-like glycosyltransferase
MLVEILQFLKMIFEGALYYLPIHMVIFVLTPLFIRVILAKKYSPAHSLERDVVKISVVIPEYKEDLAIFERCLRSVVENKPDEIIVVHDDQRAEIIDLAKKYGATVYSFPVSVGKRRALVQGWTMARGDIIVQIDSDVVLHANAINEIVKPFSDDTVMGVQGKSLVYRTNSWFSWRMSQLIEFNRDISNKALNGHLVVVDGRFNAWRRWWLLTVADSFRNDRFLCRKCEIGDDRFLTWRANLEGYKTVYQATAVAETAAPPTYIQFLRQQLRWLRSGYKAFFKDISSGLVRKVSWSYNLFQVTYYLGSISFTLAMIHDVLFAPLALSLPLWTIIPLAIFGSAMIATIRRFAIGFYQLTLKEFFMVGASSIFIAYPLSIYALITIRAQDIWGTRHAPNEASVK